MRTLALLIATLLLLSAVGARADERAVARDHYAKGTKAFDLGLYDDAIREYMAAYQVIDDPALLYNIAQAQRLAGHSADALRFYRVYLSKSPNAQNRAEVQTKIEELQKLVDQEKRTKSLPPAEAITREPAPAPAPQPATPPSASAAPSPPARSDAAGARTKVIAGAVVGAAGVALVVTGAVFGALAKKVGDELTADDQNMRTFDPAKESQGKTDQIVMGVALGVGAAAVVSGVVLVVVGVRERRAQTVAARLEPWIGRGTAGLAVGARF